MLESKFRRCWGTSNIDGLKEDHPDWVALKSICYLERERHIKDKVSKLIALYISSTDAIAKNHLYYSRQHWDGLVLNIHLLNYQMQVISKANLQVGQY